MPRFRSLAAVVALTMVAAPLSAQGLRDKLADLFKFGAGDVQLFLVGNADPTNSATVRAHGSHFIPSAVDNNGSLIAFITNAIAGNAANTPISSASGGTTFRFENGVPVATSVSPGPIFGERSPTLGKGRGSIGFNRSYTHFKSIRGVNLDDIRLIFTHQNVLAADVANCNTVFGGDCDQYGVPSYENDIVRVNLSLDLNVTVSSFYLSYGLSDRLDFSVSVPIIETALRGTSSAHIDPFGAPGNTVSHFFGGTNSNPILDAASSAFGSSSGIGDVATRLKLNLVQSARSGFSILVDARFPTGSEEDLLGSGNLAIRALAIASARFGAFTPHANAGYVKRNGALETDAVLATIGFDHLMSPWAALAADVVSEMQVGANKLRLPGTVTYTAPFRRTLQPTAIPNIRDDLVNASIGVKLKAFEDLTTVMNALIPLNRAGLRPNLTWTLGVEYNF